MIQWGFWVRVKVGAWNPNPGSIFLGLYDHNSGSTQAHTFLDRSARAFVPCLVIHTDWKLIWLDSQIHVSIGWTIDGKTNLSPLIQYEGKIGWLFSMVTHCSYFPSTFCVEIYGSVFLEGFYFWSPEKRRNPQGTHVRYHYLPLDLIPDKPQNKKDIMRWTKKSSSLAIHADWNVHLYLPVILSHLVQLGERIRRISAFLVYLLLAKLSAFCEVSFSFCETLEKNSDTKTSPTQRFCHCSPNRHPYNVFAWCLDSLAHHRVPFVALALSWSALVLGWDKASMLSQN